MKHQEIVMIVDFGGQYAQLIARRVRECGVYCEILPYNKSAKEILAQQPKGIIFSGGPSSVNAENAPEIDPDVFKAGVPILGICYGMQLMAKTLGGEVSKPEKHEYGHTDFYRNGSSALFEGVSEKTAVWMSHGDAVTEMPAGFGLTGHTDLTPTAAMADEARRFYAVQFHPEVVHTPEGTTMLKNFLFHICECEGGWSMGNYIDIAVENIREKVGDHNVICALSGGVDSSVAAALLAEAVAAQGPELAHITPVRADLRAYREGEGSFDLCACNPPYFTAGFQSSNAARATARHETDCTLEDVCACGFRLLKDGGRLALCHRPERLAEVLAVLRAHRLEPKRLAFVKNRAESAPWLFLVEAQKNRKTGLKIEPDILIAAGAAMYGKH